MYACIGGIFINGVKVNYMKAIVLAVVIYCVAFAAFAFSTLPNGERTVYTTAAGECYHKSSCSSLQYSKRQTTLQEAVDNGFRSCSNCDPPELITENRDLRVPFFAYIIFTPIVAGVAWNISAFGIALLRIDIDKIRLGHLFIVHLILSLVLLIALNIFL